MPSNKDPVCRSPLNALAAAMSFYQKDSINAKGLIHHSDRGCQYTSERYVTFFEENGISMSMPPKVLWLNSKI